MNLIFKYLGNVNCSTKDLKGGCTGSNFSVLDVYLSETGQSAKI